MKFIHAAFHLQPKNLTKKGAWCDATKLHVPNLKLLSLYALIVQGIARLVSVATPVLCYPSLLSLISISHYVGVERSVVTGRARDVASSRWDSVKTGVWIGLWTGIWAQF